MINKSKATISKYENGAISIDIQTLSEIADALEVDVANLIDYKSPNSKPAQLPKNIYFNRPRAYMYYYDGRSRKIVRSLMCISQNEADKSTLSITMYHGLESFDTPDKCQHLFVGTLKPYDTITNIYLVNQINPMEQMYICVLNPTHMNSSAIGILSGLGSNPFFAPISIKALISKDILEEDEGFINVVRLSKEDVRMFKYYNMMVINRPNSLFLKEKL